MAWLRILLWIAGLTCASAAAVACAESSDGARLNPAEGSVPAIRLPDEVLPPNQARAWELNVHCGAGFLSVQVNGKWWRTEEVPYPRFLWMPDGWPALNSGADSLLPVVLLINSAGDELRVTHAGRTVVYDVTEFTEADGCD